MSRKPVTHRRALRPVVPRILVRVGKETITGAVRRDSSHCMISEAIALAAPHMKNISTDLGTVRMTDPKLGLRYIYLTPAACQRALVQFDRGVDPEPFTFELRTCAQIVRAGTGYVRKNTGDKPKTPDVKRTMRALGDPKEPLGPKVAIRPANTGIRAQPVVVGGRPPPGNLGRTRMFGLRQLRA